MIRRLALLMLLPAVAVPLPATFAQGADDSGVADLILLKAGKVYLTPDESLDNGEILIRNGRIVSIGTDLSAPEGATVIERPEGTVTAGLIDANSTAGYRSARSRAEHRSECIPELHVLDTLDLGSRDFDQLASSGVTTVYVSADSASVIGAQGAILHTGGPRDRRVVRKAYGIKATIGREPVYKASRNRGPFGIVSYLTRRPTTRMGLVWVFRKAFHDAALASRGQTPETHGEGTPSEASIQVLIRVLKGEIPLRIQARAQLDILTAIRLGREFNVSFILEEGTDAYRCIDVLRENKVPVIYGPLFDYPRGARAGSGEANRYRYSAPAALLKGGITLALSANDLGGEASLPRQAMYAMRFGLTRAQALAAVTVTPARLLEIEDVAGLIAEGRPADIVLWSGEPFAATTRAEAVVIGGHLVKRPNTE